MTRQERCKDCYCSESVQEKCPIKFSKYWRKCPCAICLFKITCKDLLQTCKEYRRLLEVAKRSKEFKLNKN